MHEIGCAQYVAITDKEALEAFQLSCSTEDIIPALEPAHALAHVMKIAPGLPRNHIICMNMCGRGDKDIFTVAKHLGFDMNTGSRSRAWRRRSQSADRGKDRPDHGVCDCQLGQRIGDGAGVAHDTGTNLDQLQSAIASGSSMQRRKVARL